MLTVDVWFVHIGNVSRSDHKTKKAAAEQAQQINAEMSDLSVRPENERLSNSLAY